MRRLGLFVAAALLLLAFAVPVSAAERVRESGTFYNFSSYSQTCSATICTQVGVDVFSVDADTVVVCVTEFSYNTRTGRLVSDTSGCTETTQASLSITSGLVVNLAATEVTLFDCNQRRCTEGDTVTVSASDTAIGPVSTVTGRVTFKDGTCTTRITFSDRSAEVAGTLTIDGTTVDEQGYATISEQTASTLCR